VLQAFRMHEQELVKKQEKAIEEYAAKKAQLKVCAIIAARMAAAWEHVFNGRCNFHQNNITSQTVIYNMSCGHSLTSGP
jgi:hypothetical protein